MSCHHCRSVAQSCLILCDPMDCSKPGLPVPYHHPKFAHPKVHIHCIHDTIQPSYPQTPSAPSALSLCQHQGLFQWVDCHIRWAYVLYWALNKIVLQENISVIYCSVYQHYLYCTDLWKAETSLESHSLEIYIVNKIFLLRVADESSKTSKISWSCVWWKWSVFTEWSVAVTWLIHWLWRWLSPLPERGLNTQDSDATSWHVHLSTAATLAGCPQTRYSESPAYKSSSCELLKMWTCILMFIHVC